MLKNVMLPRWHLTSLTSSWLHWTLSLEFWDKARNQPPSHPALLLQLCCQPEIPQHFPSILCVSISSTKYSSYTIYRTEGGLSAAAFCRIITRVRTVGFCSAFSALTHACFKMLVLIISPAGTNLLMAFTLCQLTNWFLTVCLYSSCFSAWWCWCIVLGTGSVYMLTKHTVGGVTASRMPRSSCVLICLLSSLCL